MDELIKKYDEVYSDLYENDNYTVISNLATIFDCACKDENFKLTVSDFCKARGDIISSDREAAAFILMFANA